MSRVQGVGRQPASGRPLALLNAQHRPQRRPIPWRPRPIPADHRHRQLGRMAGGRGRRRGFGRGLRRNIADGRGERAAMRQEAEIRVPCPRVSARRTTIEVSGGRRRPSDPRSGAAKKITSSDKKKLNRVSNKKKVHHTSAPLELELPRTSTDTSRGGRRYKTAVAVTRATPPSPLPALPLLNSGQYRALRVRLTSRK